MRALPEAASATGELYGGWVSDQGRRQTHGPGKGGYFSRLLNPLTHVRAVNLSIMGLSSPGNGRCRFEVFACKILPEPSHYKDVQSSWNITNKLYLYRHIPTYTYTSIYEFLVVLLPFSYTVTYLYAFGLWTERPL